MELTKKQTLFLILVCLVANKVQRLPSLISTSVGRHGWLAFLTMGVLDILFLIVTLLFNKKAKFRTTYEICESAGGKIYAKIMFFIMAVYFLLNSLLPYEAVHDLFANILFDKLSWNIYGIALALSVFFIASKGLKNIGRLAELFFYIIASSFLILLILGAVTTNYLHVLPVQDINAISFIRTCLEYNLWFGDFILIYIFVGKIKQNNKPLGAGFVLLFSLTVVLISFAYVVYYGLYENLSINQNSLISSISQFSLLGLDIGRIDWFLVLFFQISTVISSSTYIFATAYCIRKVLGIRKDVLLCFIIAAIIYLLDIFIFKSVQAGASIIASVSKYFALFMVIVYPIIMFITVLISDKKNRKQINKMPKNMANYMKFIRAYKSKRPLKREGTTYAKDL